MKRLICILAAFAALQAPAQEIALPAPDAKSLGMGGVAMTIVGGSHAIYNNNAMAAFSRTPIQLSSTYSGQGDHNFYAVTGSARVGMNNTALLGWRQYLRGAGNNDMALDLGYTRRLGERWGVGAVARYLHLKRPNVTADALSVDLTAAWMLPLENVGSYSSVLVGAKLANLGGYFKSPGYTLPTNFTVGGAFDTFITDAHQITVGVDAGYYFNPAPVSGFQMSVGAEYNLMQLVQLRAGYHYGEQKQFYPSYGSVGAGVRFLHLRLDFAYLFAAKDTYLRNTYSISFGLDF